MCDSHVLGDGDMWPAIICRKGVLSSFKTSNEARTSTSKGEGRRLTQAKGSHQPEEFFDRFQLTITGSHYQEEEKNRRKPTEKEEQENDEEEISEVEEEEDDVRSGTRRRRATRYGTSRETVREQWQAISVAAHRRRSLTKTCCWQDVLNQRQPKGIEEGEGQDEGDKEDAEEEAEKITDEEEGAEDKHTKKEWRIAVVRSGSTDEIGAALHLLDLCDLRRVVILAQRKDAREMVLGRVGTAFCKTGLGYANGLINGGHTCPVIHNRVGNHFERPNNNSSERRSGSSGLGLRIATQNGREEMVFQQLGQSVVLMGQSQESYESEENYMDFIHHKYLDAVWKDEKTPFVPIILMKAGDMEVYGEIQVVNLKFFVLQSYIEDMQWDPGGAHSAVIINWSLQFKQWDPGIKFFKPHLEGKVSVLGGVLIGLCKCM